MPSNTERTLVGVPFYDGEGEEVLRACLNNLDKRLSELKVDAHIVIAINGPRVSRGETPLSTQIERSQYNATIKFIRTPPGIVQAEKAIGRLAEVEGYSRIFLTDADISRLPDSLNLMWQKGDKPVIGANYATYPIEIMHKSGLEFGPEEIALMRIFEADKHPLARRYTMPYRPATRLKGSLLLVNTAMVKYMFGLQKTTSDSRMNLLVDQNDRQLIPEACFLHYPRTNLTDHIQARLRHFLAAWAENDLPRLRSRSMIYTPNQAEAIAKNITYDHPNHPDAIQVASDFLKQCALRHLVTNLCLALCTGNPVPKALTQPNKIYHCDNLTLTYEHAHTFITALLHQCVDIEMIANKEPSQGRCVTQQDLRTPIDLDPLIESTIYRNLITQCLGI